MISCGDVLPNFAAKASPPAQCNAQLPSFPPLEASLDMTSWLSLMTEANSYPQSVVTPPSEKVIKTLIAYADNEEDPRRKSTNEGFRRRIKKILAMISSQICKLDCTWQEITIQDLWKYEDHLKYAHLILLLIDENFIISEYCHCEELKNAILRHFYRTAYIAPIYLRPCLTERVPFARIPFFPPRTQKAVSECSNKDTVFNAIMKDIIPLVQDIKDRILPPF